MTPAAHTPKPHADRRRQRQRSERLGRIAELAAAAFMMLKGYRILGRRVRTRYGELDLITIRGRRLAIVEVKYRQTLEAAKLAITHAQADRVATAAEQWAGARPAYRDLHLGLDAIYLAPWRLPRHEMDALH